MSLASIFQNTNSFVSCRVGSPLATASIFPLCFIFIQSIPHFTRFHSIELTFHSIEPTFRLQFVVTTFSRARSTKCVCWEYKNNISRPRVNNKDQPTSFTNMSVPPFFTTVRFKLATDYRSKPWLRQKILEVVKAASQRIGATEHSAPIGEISYVNAFSAGGT